MFWWKIFKKLEKIVLHLFFHEKIQTPTVASPYPRGSWFEQILKYTTCLHTSFGFSGQMVCEKKNLKKQWFLLFFKFLIIFPSKRTWLIRITRHAVNQGSKFGFKKMAQCRILEAMKIRKVYDNDDSEHILSRKTHLSPRLRLAKKSNWC